MAEDGVFGRLLVHFSFFSSAERRPHVKTTDGVSLGFRASAANLELLPIFKINISDQESFESHSDLDFVPEHQ